MHERDAVPGDLAALLGTVDGARSGPTELRFYHNPDLPFMGPPNSSPASPPSSTPAMSSA